MTDMMQTPLPDQGPPPETVAAPPAPNMAPPAEAAMPLPAETPPGALGQGMSAGPEMGAAPPAMGPPESNAGAAEPMLTGKLGELEKIAVDYAVPISEPALATWTEKSTGDHKVFKDYIVQMACGLFPTLAPQIQAGIPTQTLLDPYVMIAQQILGPDTQPDWNDPKWGQALQGGTDPKTGRPIPMTLDEWRRTLTSDPGHGWDKTPQAHQRANDFADALDASFSGNGEMG